MSYPHSCVLICTADDKPAMDALSVQLGHVDPGSEVFTVPLSADGQEPVTHYGMHTWAQDGFVGLVEAALSGSLPPGFPPETQQLMQRCIWSHRTDSGGYPHWSDVLASHGLQPIEQQA